MSLQRRSAAEEHLAGQFLREESISNKEILWYIAQQLEDLKFPEDKDVIESQ
jgi:hypothetical protein